MRILVRSVAVFAGFCLLSGAAFAQQNSGFLGDSYSKLKDAESPSKQKVKRWVDASVTPGKYEAVLLAKTVYYPEPKGTDQVSKATLDQVSAYLDEALRRELGGVTKLATEPGPKTLRLRVAITGAAAKDAALKPYQVIPIAFIFSRVDPTKVPTLAIEYEAQDTDTNQVVGAGMREGSGVDLKNASDKLTLAMFKPVIDSWAKDARAFVEAAKVKK